ncbi:TPA: hypothetical protein HA239_00995 [Candidatus Woesearchaeota archaeon]|nr:hypothetical protein QT06_C0001G0238 [archaeon GW2011_AR15]MBS3103963.1 hypothetical protein [Candidatus Woesearchaeota archaeon]HIH40969.1 hypothetical protein [Candidatus Woesearchaeota archaeon]
MTDIYEGLEAYLPEGEYIKKMELNEYTDRRYEKPGLHFELVVEVDTGRNEEIGFSSIQKYISENNLPIDRIRQCGRINTGKIYSGWTISQDTEKGVEYRMRITRQLDWNLMEFGKHKISVTAYSPSIEPLQGLAKAISEYVKLFK